MLANCATHGLSLCNSNQFAFDTLHPQTAEKKHKTGKHFIGVGNTTVVFCGSANPLSLFYGCFTH